MEQLTDGSHILNISANSVNANTVVGVSNLSAPIIYAEFIASDDGIGGNLSIGAVDEKIGFFGVTPVLQQDDAIAGDTGAAGSGTGVFQNSTWGAGGSLYTIGQIVAALRLYGLLA